MRPVTRRGQRRAAWSVSPDTSVSLRKRLLRRIDETCLVSGKRLRAYGTGSGKRAATTPHEPEIGNVRASVLCALPGSSMPRHGRGPPQGLETDLRESL